MTGNNTDERAGDNWLVELPLVKDTFKTSKETTMTKITDKTPYSMFFISP